MPKKKEPKKPKTNSKPPTLGVKVKEVIHPKDKFGRR